MALHFRGSCRRKPTEGEISLSLRHIAEQEHTAYHQRKPRIFRPRKGELFAPHKPECVDERRHQKLRYEYDRYRHRRAEALYAEHDGQRYDDAQNAAKPVELIHLPKLGEASVTVKQQHRRRKQEGSTLNKHVRLRVADALAEAGVHNALNAHRHSRNYAENYSPKHENTSRKFAAALANPQFV